jgi:hypothetical protein
MQVCRKARNSHFPWRLGLKQDLEKMKERIAAIGLLGFLILTKLV